MRNFENPANGYIESFDSGGALWGLFFLGGFYLALKGFWGHFLLYVAILLFVATSGQVLFVLAAHGVLFLLYGAMIGHMVATKYYRKGWVELVPGADAAQEEVESRKCPFCAEEIKAEAIKCKHCHSDVVPLRS